MIDVIIGRIVRLRDATALERLLSPGVENPAYDYGVLVGTVRGLTLALEELQRMLEEERGQDESNDET